MKTLSNALIALFLVYTSFVLAQPNIQFKKSQHDFGEIVEGPTVTHEFEFTNTGNEPLVVAQANPSCGCTVPEWSKDPIAPGKSGKIKATFSTQGRPGPFTKSISVVSNSTPATSTLYFRGTVVNEVAPTYSEDELRRSPKLVLENDTHDFGKMEKNSKLVLRLPIKNLGRSDLKISSVTSSCNCVEYVAKQDFIASSADGILELVYKPNTTGELSDYIYIKSNDITNASYKYLLKVNVVESLTSPSMIQQGKSSVPFK